MRIEIIPCGFLKVDADQMHNHFERSERWSGYQLDGKGRMRISMNALLVDSGDKLVLFDPGCADFLPARMLASYDLEIPQTLEKNLEILGYGVDQVTDVIFTHLHFDHGSGAFLRRPGRIEKRLPRARYHVLKEHFEYAAHPGKGEAGSFAMFLFNRLERVYWLEEWTGDWLKLKVFNGHTRAMVVPLITGPGGLSCYLTDLIPLTSFLDSEISSGFDLDPDLARKEKNEFLQSIPKNTELIFFHDPLVDKKIYP